MANPRQRRGRAKISLGLSFVFAVAAFGYLALAGSPVQGAGVGLLVVLAGLWEYRRNLQNAITAERYEAEAQRHEAERRENR